MVGFHATEGAAAGEVIKHLKLHSISDCCVRIDKQIELCGSAIVSAVDSSDFVNQRIGRGPIMGYAVIGRNRIGSGSATCRERKRSSHSWRGACQNKQCIA